MRAKYGSTAGNSAIGGEEIARAFGVVFVSPSFDQYFGFDQCVEDLPIQQLVAELSIERFDVSVFPGASWLNEQRLHVDSAEPLRYIDLMGGTKPHLLVKSVNNVGAETQVEYAPSTQFNLADKREGRPWVTRLWTFPDLMDT